MVEQCIEGMIGKTRQSYNKLLIKLSNSKRVMSKENTFLEMQSTIND